MDKFLSKDDSAFYHITSPENWRLIQEEKKIKAKKGKIFVIRSSDENIISSLAIGQLEFIYHCNEMVILKLPQKRNSFKSSEVGIDSQSNEPTMPLQNIIYRKDIPLNNIELFKIFKYEIRTLNKNAAQFDNFKDNFKEFIDSFEIIYNINNKSQKLIKMDGLNNYTLVDY